MAKKKKKKKKGKGKEITRIKDRSGYTWIGKRIIEERKLPPEKKKKTLKLMKKYRENEVFAAFSG